jgi:murein DD-endopeptidase MepM/ murein hydrolase activator NlpD
MRRQLALKTPHLEGADVKEVQKKVGLTGNDVDGFYGPVTATRVMEWKWKSGYPENRINSTLGLPGLGLLFGEIKFPADFVQRAEQRKGKPFVTRKDGVVRPLPTVVPRFSEFLIPDPEGAPDNTGKTFHAGLDWFAAAGTVVRAPVAGRIIEANPSKGTKGQVFGGTVKIEASDRKVWIFRHVVPSVSVGGNVSAGQPVASVSRWDDGPEHAHIELRKTNEGGHRIANMEDPLKFFK